MRPLPGAGAPTLSLQERVQIKRGEVVGNGAWFPFPKGKGLGVRFQKKGLGLRKCNIS